MWEPAAEDKVTTWNQVNPKFPAEKIELYGPGTDSGTFDYFTDAINGEEGASRSDYNASEDDNVTRARASADPPNALGYFGYTYFEENADTLKAVEVDSGDGCVAPSAETAQDGTYAPLSRPLFIYVNNDGVRQEDAGRRVRRLLRRERTRRSPRRPSSSRSTTSSAPSSKTRPRELKG